MEELNRYFPDLTPLQKERFALLDGLYREWNEKINVISRKDIDNLYEHHVLHSLAIAKAVQFPAGAEVLDVGTGGGFPGIPLAIMFPDVHFTLCDSIGKKIKVAQAVAECLGLENVTFLNCRAESIGGSFDYVVSRAVADLSDFYGWVKNLLGGPLYYLKGGDVEDEISRCVSRHHINPAKVTICDISLWFGQEWFDGKKVVILSK
jgi:16S rRNA (guanine(527)-N(7))-methyltransferase GidB